MRAGQIDLLDLELPLHIRPSAAFSDAQLIRFSEQNKPYRIEKSKEGDIVVMTPVGGIGGSNEMFVSYTLAAWTERDGTGIAFSPNTGFNLRDGSCLSPDAAWVPLQRWNALSAEEQATFLPFCPSFLIEVRSSTDRRIPLELKMQQWIDNGAELAWLVDPIDATVTIYRPGHETQTLERPDVVLGEGPVSGFELRCTRLWPAR